MGEGNGFDQYKLMLLDWHNQDKAAHTRIDDKLVDIEKAIVSLKTQAKIWGAVAGFFGSAVMMIIVTLLAK